jgi:hypothetical protein
MDLGWKVMLPLGIIWVFLTGFAVVVRTWARTTTDPGPTLITWAAVLIGVFALLYLVAPLFAATDADAEVAATDRGPGGGGGGTRRPVPPGDAGGDGHEPQPVSHEELADDTHEPRPAGV